jgi:penicillin-binding protein 1B
VLKRLFVHLSWFVFGMSLGLIVPWVWWLDREAGQRFSERQWTQSSRVYARPLELYAGRPISPADLVVELEAAGLQAGHPGSIGYFSRHGERFDIHLPGFSFPDQVQAPTRVRLDIQAGILRNIQATGGTPTSLVRLPPAELGNLLPLDDRDRTLVNLADFPPLLVTGIQAVEDRQFKHHHGFDPRGLVRAAWANLRQGQVVQGGSTITQQLVKNLFLTPDRSLVRKFNEAVMALSLERRFDKTDILEAYLNEVYLGQDGANAIHGFGGPANTISALPVQALAPEQIALLIGMVRGASWYHPQRNPERARERRDRVLEMFAETGLIGSKDLASGAWLDRCKCAQAASDAAASTVNSLIWWRGNCAVITVIVTCAVPDCAFSQPWIRLPRPTRKRRWPAV